MLLSRYLSYYKNLSKDKILNLCNKEFRDLSENQKNFKEVIKLLFEIAKKFPKVKVIFRKHPNQKYSDFIELFKNKPSNLILVYDNNITPWIKACKVYIHSGCTTVHEAFMLRKKILFF
jgi:surface carbohydrate biosynthesis protein